LRKAKVYSDLLLGPNSKQELELICGDLTARIFLAVYWWIRIWFWWHWGRFQTF